LSNYLNNYYPNCVRQTTPLGRAYKDPKDESKHPHLALSVTTILGLLLNKGVSFHTWLKTHGRHSDTIRDYKANLGTVVHLLCEDLFNLQRVTLSHTKERINNILSDADIREGGGFYSTLLTVQLYLESFCKWYEDHDVKTYETELQLYDNRVPYAGTVDWIGEISGVPSILDIKTGMPHDEHGYQLVAYGMLHNFMFPKNKIKDLYVLYLKSGYRKEPTYTMKKISWDLKDTWKSQLRLAIDMYGKEGKWVFKEKFKPREEFQLKESK